MNLNRHLRFLCKAVLISFAALSFSGCATKMALDANKGSLATLNKPIGIFTLRTENAYKPSYEPDVKKIHVVSSSSRNKKTFAPNKPYKKGKNEFLEYLVSVDLQPGDYSLGHIEGFGGGFPIKGWFNFPVNARFNLSSGVTYLGHVTMTNRKRKEGEERSGGIIPLIDQAVTGFSGGTFDVTVTDASEADIPEFVKIYPPLRGINIAKAIMQK